MRVLILHDDTEEAQSIRVAAWRCWGNPPLVQVDVASSGSAKSWRGRQSVTRELMAKLASQSRWPDTDPVRTVLGELIAVWHVLEREPSLITGLAQHPARGFFRTLIIVEGSDEYGRATLWQAPGDLVMAPPTAARFAQSRRYPRLAQSHLVLDGGAGIPTQFVPGPVHPGLGRYWARWTGSKAMTAFEGSA